MNKEKHPNIVLLLTACINPNGMAYTVLQTADVRRQQYEEAIAWYLRHTPYYIVVVENTGKSINDELIQNERVEYITFQGNDYPRSLGKGYGEALIIKEGMARSEWLRNADLIMKITGRVVVKNVQAIVKQCAKMSRRGNSVCGDINFKQKKAPSVCFVASPSFFCAEFFEAMCQCDDSAGIDFETVLYQRYVAWMDSGNEFRVLAHRPDICGVSGSTGHPYPKPPLSDKCRNLLRDAYLNFVIRHRKVVVQGRYTNLLK